MNLLRSISPPGADPWIPGSSEAPEKVGGERLQLRIDTPGLV